MEESMKKTQGKKVTPTKKQTKKVARAKIRAEQVRQRKMEMLRKGWDRQQQLETRLAALSGILEAREKNIRKHQENLEASQAVLAARKLHAAEARKALKEMGKQPLPVTQNQ